MSQQFRNFHALPSGDLHGYYEKPTLFLRLYVQIAPLFSFLLFLFAFWLLDNRQHFRRKARFDFDSIVLNTLHNYALYL